MTIKLYRWVMILFAGVFTLCGGFGRAGATSVEEILSDDVRFSIRGDSGRFCVDKQAGRVSLADCIVVSVRAHKTTWEIPGPYRSQETVQQIFDLLATSEMVPMDEARIAALDDMDRDYFAYSGLAIDFKSPKGASRPPIYQKPGRGYGTLSLSPLDADAGEDLQNTLHVQLLLHTRKGFSARQCYIRSGELYDLVTRMSEQSYEAGALTHALSVDVHNCEAIAEYAMPCRKYATLRREEYLLATVRDPSTIERLATLLSAGEKMNPRVKISPFWLLRFSMPDGTVHAAYIASPEPSSAAEEKWNGYVFAVVGGDLYVIDQDAQKEVTALLDLRARDVRRLTWPRPNGQLQSVVE